MQPHLRLWYLQFTEHRTWEILLNCTTKKKGVCHLETGGELQVLYITELGSHLLTPCLCAQCFHRSLCPSWCGEGGVALKLKKCGLRSLICIRMSCWFQEPDSTEDLTKGCPGQTLTLQESRTAECSLDSPERSGQELEDTDEPPQVQLEDSGSASRSPTHRASALNTFGVYRASIHTQQSLPRWAVFGESLC